MLGCKRSLSDQQQKMLMSKSSGLTGVQHTRAYQQDALLLGPLVNPMTLVVKVIKWRNTSLDHSKIRGLTSQSWRKFTWQTSPRHKVESDQPLNPTQSCSSSRPKTSEPLNIKIDHGRSRCRSRGITNHQAVGLKGGLVQPTAKMKERAARIKWVDALGCWVPAAQNASRGPHYYSIINAAPRAERKPAPPRPVSDPTRAGGKSEESSRPKGAADDCSKELSSSRHIQPRVTEKRDNGLNEKTGARARNMLEDFERLSMRPDYDDSLVSQTTQPEVLDPIIHIHVEPHDMQDTSLWRVPHDIQDTSLWRGPHDIQDTSLWRGPHDIQDTCLWRSPLERESSCSELSKHGKDCQPTAHRSQEKPHLPPASDLNKSYRPPGTEVGLSQQKSVSKGKRFSQSERVNSPTSQKVNMKPPNSTDKPSQRSAVYDKRLKSPLEDGHTSQIKSRSRSKISDATSSLKGLPKLKSPTARKNKRDLLQTPRRDRKSSNTHTNDWRMLTAAKKQVPSKAGLPSGRPELLPLSGPDDQLTEDVSPTAVEQTTKGDEMTSNIFHTEDTQLSVEDTQLSDGDAPDHVTDSPVPEVVDSTAESGHDSATDVSADEQQNQRKRFKNIRFTGAIDTITKKRRPKEIDPDFLEEQRLVKLSEERRRKLYNRFGRTKSRLSLSTGGSEGSFHGSSVKDEDFLSKYCIFQEDSLEQYRQTFNAWDRKHSGWLSYQDTMRALRDTASELDQTDEDFLCRILELIGYRISFGADFQLFSVLAALSRKITAMDSCMKLMICEMNFQVLEMKAFICKTLWEVCVDPESKTIPIDQLIIELRSGGVSPQHEESIKDKLGHLPSIDFLDFLTYSPLFFMIHQSIVTNPLSDVRET